MRRIMIKWLFAAVMIAAVSIGCGSGGNPGGPSGSVTYGSFTDPRDGKRYRTVEIGGLTWMAENLNHKTERSMCYNDRPDFCVKYGSLYTWSDAMALDKKMDTTWWNGDYNNPLIKHQGVCPVGWRVSRSSDWDDLLAAVGDSGTAGTKLKSATGWNGNGNGANMFGFSATPGGGRHTKGGFWGAGNNGFWWCTGGNNRVNGWFRGIAHNREHVGSGTETKTFGFSVRCVRDN